MTLTVDLGLSIRLSMFEYVGKKGKNVGFPGVDPTVWVRGMAVRPLQRTAASGMKTLRRCAPSEKCGENRVSWCRSDYVGLRNGSPTPTVRSG